MMGFQEPRDDFRGLLLNTLRFLPAHVILVYSFLYFLIPKLLLKKRYGWFAFWLLVVLAVSVVYMIIVPFRLNIHSPFFTRRLITRSLFANFNICGIAVAIKLFKYWYAEREAKLAAERSNLTSQLALLKSQVHPHFLFNTLNNLYSLALVQSSKAPEVVLKLSDLLRYMLYDCNVERILLSKEIEMINNYIELEKQRYGKRLDVSINYSGDLNDKYIAPLLLLPFIENSFKHGASEQLEQCWISLDLFVEKEELFFKLVNGYTKHENTDGDRQGIGLENVRRRLELLYPNDHELKITADDDTYTVSLQLNLESNHSNDI